MRLFAIESSTDRCSVAAYHDGEVIEEFERSPRQHGRHIMVLLDKIQARTGMSPRDLDAIAFGRGPGSFTGVRIATSVCQGLGYAVDRPLVPVSTLHALATSMEHPRVATLMDARMGQVYAATWRRSEPDFALVNPESVCDPEALPPLEGDDWYGAGSGFAEYGDRIPEGWTARMVRVDPEARPTAASIAALGAAAFERGECVSADQAMPTYLRDRVADESAKSRPTASA